jgi:hypothetical protein
MSASGSASSTTRSASLPTSTVPRRSPAWQSSAEVRVAATMACIGVMPQATSCSISTRVFSSMGLESAPQAILTPAASALLEALAVRPLGAAGLLDLVRVHAAAAHELVVLRHEQRGDPVGAVLGHQLDRLVVEVVAVLDAVDAAADRGLDALGPPACTHTRLPFWWAAAVAASISSGNIWLSCIPSPAVATPPVIMSLIWSTPRLQLLAHRLAGLIGAVDLDDARHVVAMAAGGDDGVAAGEHVRPDHEVHRECALPGLVDAVLLADHPQAGEAGAERVQGVAARADGALRGRFANVSFLASGKIAPRWVCTAHRPGST